MNKKEVTDKGVFTWGAFTAIMIIVVCAAVLVFIFKVKVGDEKYVHLKIYVPLPCKNAPNELVSQEAGKSPADKL